MPNIAAIVTLFFIMTLNVLSGDWAKLYDSTLKYNKLGEYKSALEFGNKSLKSAELEFGTKDTAYLNTIAKLVEINFSLGDYSSALNLARLDSSTREENFGDKDPGFAKSMNDLAMIYTIIGNNGNAEILFNKSIGLIKQYYGEKHQEYARSLNNIAWFYNRTGRFIDAEPIYLQSLQIYREIYGDSSQECAVSMNNIASVYLKMGRFDDAENKYKLSLEIRKSEYGEDHPKYSQSLNNLASLYKKTGKYNLAEKLYISAIEISKAKYGDNHPVYATYINNLGDIFRLTGRNEKALELYLEAEKIIKNKFSEEHINYADCLNNLSSLYISNREFATALPLLKNTVNIYLKKAGKSHPLTLKYMNNLAVLYTRTRKYAESDSIFNEILMAVKDKSNEFGELIPNIYSSIAGLKLYSGEPFEAENYYKLSIDKRRDYYGEMNPETITSVLNLASYYHFMNRYDDAAIYYDLGLNGMIKFINETFSSLSEKEKLQFYSTLKLNFEKYNSFAVERATNDVSTLEKMYDYWLETKAILMKANTKIRKKILESGNQKLIDKYIDWKSKRDYLATLSSMNLFDKKTHNINIDSLSQVVEILEKELSTESGAFGSDKNNKGINFEDIRKSLKQNEAAIEIIRFREFGRKTLNDSVSIPGFTNKIKYAALILKGQSLRPELVIINNGNDLEELNIRSYRFLVKNYSLGLRTQNFGIIIPEEPKEFILNELYHAFFKNIHENLSGIETVYLSIDGVYNQLNLNTLIDDNNKYIAESLDIRILTSTKDLIDRDISQKSKNDILIVADPQYDLDTNSRTVVPLPGTRQEAELISGLMTEHKYTSSTFIGINATEENVKKAASPHVLHLATHGKFLEDIKIADEGLSDDESLENPLMRSFLLFSGAGETLKGENLSTDLDDGILTAYEVLNLDLDNTDMVVLSACETGLGEIMNGEGVFGLQRSFIVAGTKSLIMSLWSVNDEVAVKLMELLYTYYLDGMGKRESFRRAILDIKNKYPHFYYWGPFVMIGS